MPNLHTRREVLTMAGAGLAGLAAAAPSASRPEHGVVAATQDEIRVFRTCGEKRWAAETAIRWRPAGTAAGSAIRLDTGRTFQDIVGFGASFTDSASYMINQLDPGARAQLLHELFHPSEMAFSVSRLCIGSSDYATSAYSYDEGDPDPDMARFSIDRDREYVLPILVETRRVNPGLFLLASPWSPPGWMKANGSMLGGSMRKRHFASYAKYFVRFLQGYAAAGVPVDAVTTQNEVDTEQDGRMPACLWGQEYEIEFIARHLGPQLSQNNLATKIWILDHNYNLWGRAISTLDEAAVAGYVDGVAWHGYAGRPEMMTRVHDAHPGKHMYWTEGGPDYKSPAYLKDWTRWSANFTGILRNWSRCIIGWNLALDEQGRPNIGPFSCGGVITINSTTHEIVRSGMYWALAHYSRAIQRGARRFDSQGTVDGVSHVAFANPGGSFAVVATNAGAERTVRFELANRVAEVALPTDSVTSLLWGPSPGAA
jgi:glucosylceramidase